jgi:hypothetical protein
MEFPKAYRPRLYFRRAYRHWPTSRTMTSLLLSPLRSLVESWIGNLNQVRGGSGVI